MRKMGILVLAAALWAAPRPANAGWILEGSFGLPWQTNPSFTRQPVNLMVTPGYGFLDNFLRAELGLVANLGDVQNSSFSVGLRPMVAVHPPFLPLYGKLIFDWNSIGDNATANFGGAIGTSFGVGIVSLFFEGDYLPRPVRDTNLHVVELRGGVSFAL